MKKLFLLLIGLAFAVSAYSQAVVPKPAKPNLMIQSTKQNSDSLGSLSPENLVSDWLVASSCQNYS